MQNIGTADTATGVTVTDPLDSRLTPGTMPAGCTAAGQTVTCGGAGTTVAPGGSISYQIPVTVDPGLYTDIPPQRQMVNGEAQCGIGTLAPQESVTPTCTETPGPQPTGARPGGGARASGGLGPSGGLPFTGAPLALAGLGAGLIGAGLVFGAAARRRRRA